MSEAKHTINWFEIPVSQMDRAMKFYSAIFGVEMQKMDWQGIQMAFFLERKIPFMELSCRGRATYHRIRARSFT